MKWIEPTVFAKSCGNPDFRSIFGHQRAKNEGTNTKIDRGPETYPISINPRDEMNRADSFRENCRNPDFRSIFGHQRAKNAGTNTKIDRGPETYPISINPRDEMNWANSFREKLRKPCLQTDRRTDGRTDGQTSGWIQYTPFPPSVERGYKNFYPTYIYVLIQNINTFTIYSQLLPRYIYSKWFHLIHIGAYTGATVNRA